MERAARVDANGCAFAGSQRWIQHFVNHQRDALESAILQSLPSLREFGTEFEWVSPLERERFAEYRDQDFLDRVGLAAHSAELRLFWPQRGPCWDALAKLRSESGGAVVLVEAKSYVQEIHGSGCQASATSREKISRSLDAAKKWAGADAQVDWLGPLYQSANRLAHLYFLREIVRVPVWLINVCFVNDPHSPTTLDQWRLGLAEIDQQLGLPPRDVPFVGAVFLEVQPRV